MTFKVGDQVVHPQYGVGHVVKLEEKEFELGLTRLYYELSMSGGSTVWAPVDGTTVGLRKLAAKKEIAHCREILAAHPMPLTEDVRSRQTVLMARLRQGTIITFCEVLRDLYAHGEHKSLYGSMAGFFRQTQNVLCQEWATVEGIPLAEAFKEVDALLDKSREVLNIKKKK
jgi:RNA polymerase-interacting CarD/CdnL/TRCF family regulator